MGTLARAKGLAGRPSALQPGRIDLAIEHQPTREQCPLSGGLPDPSKLDVAVCHSIGFTIETFKPRTSPGRLYLVPEHEPDEMFGPAVVAYSTACRLAVRAAIEQSPPTLRIWCAAFRAWERAVCRRPSAWSDTWSRPERRVSRAGREQAVCTGTSSGSTGRDCNRLAPVPQHLGSSVISTAPAGGPLVRVAFGCAQRLYG